MVGSANCVMTNVALSFKGARTSSVGILKTIDFSLTSLVFFQNSSISLTNLYVRVAILDCEKRNKLL